MNMENTDFNNKSIYRAAATKIKIPCPVSDSDLAYYEYPLPVFARQRGASFPKFPENELLDIFPEAKHVLTEKINEWEQESATFLDSIKNELASMYKLTLKEAERWIRRELLKMEYDQGLTKIERHISRLRRLKFRASGRVMKGQLTDDQIQLARAMPIENIVNQHFRKSGKTLVGLCPFHEERHPSFYIYTDENRCWCYGCNQGGDAIKFIRLQNGYSFKQAVQYLISK
jgi:hypothetical protein